VIIVIQRSVVEGGCSAGGVWLSAAGSIHPEASGRLRRPSWTGFMFFGQMLETRAISLAGDRCRRSRIFCWCLRWVLYYWMDARAEFSTSSFALTARPMVIANWVTILTSASGLTVGHVLILPPAQAHRGGTFCGAGRHGGALHDLKPTALLLLPGVDCWGCCCWAGRTFSRWERHDAEAAVRDKGSGGEILAKARRPSRGSVFVKVCHLLRGAAAFGNSADAPGTEDLELEVIFRCPPLGGRWETASRYRDRGVFRGPPANRRDLHRHRTSGRKSPLRGAAADYATTEDEPGLWKKSWRGDNVRDRGGLSSQTGVP